MPIRATHAAWFFATGHWPRLHLLHRCDNPSCCNVRHLYEGTHAQNMKDRRERRPRYGARNPAARHAGVVDEIRRRVDAGETQAAICDDLHLNSGVVSRIARGINYPAMTPVVSRAGAEWAIRLNGR
jgi:hypothetical protein